MRAPLPVLLACLVIACTGLSGCSGGGDDDGACSGSETRFRAHVPGLHALLAERPAGLDVATVAAPQGMRFEGELPWDGAQVQSVSWRDGDGSTESVVTLSGEGRDLHLAAEMPGALDQGELHGRILTFLAQATTLEGEGRQAVADGLEWRSADGRWHAAADLDATARLPQPLAALSGAPTLREAGLRQYTSQGYDASIRLPVQQATLEAEGLTAVLEVDEDDQARDAVRSGRHAQADAERVHEAMLALAGEDSRAWNLEHEDGADWDC